MRGRALASHRARPRNPGLLPAPIATRRGRTEARPYRLVATDYAASAVALVEPILSRPGPIPRGTKWSYEVKWNGFRALVTTGSDFRVGSGRGWNMTAVLPEFRRLQAGLVLDGELSRCCSSSARSSAASAGKNVPAVSRAHRRVRCASPRTPVGRTCPRQRRSRLERREGPPGQR